VAVVQAAWTALGDAIAAGAVTPVVAQQFPLDDVDGALAALRADGHVGKLVIAP
jgi:NADPH:quinone reductase-like Zn-dependent oxidoreductase